MKTEIASRRFTGFARPATLGALLRVGPEPLSVVWSNAARGVHVVGLGVVAEGGGEIDWLGEVPRLPAGPWFGGWPFDPLRAWAGFEGERWVLPEVLTWWHGGRAWQAAFGPEGVSQTQLIARLDAVSEIEPFTAGLTSVARPGDSAHWSNLVQAALQAIDEGRFSKVVAARVIDVDCERAWPERAIMKALEARHPQCFTFLVRGRDGRAFIGASPEVLCEAEGDVFLTDALAGTASKGQGESLLRSQKDRREHVSVVDGIRESLAPFALNLEIPHTPSVKTLANVDHLHTPIRARLKPGVQALELARQLHPTPAVAGRPREASMKWLREHEPFARGWYTGVVGAMGPAHLTLAVGLRSALLDGSKAQVFVGAGIVEGSESEAEWLETERKARAVLPALGVNDG